MAKKKIDELEIIEKLCDSIIQDSELLIKLHPTNHTYYKGQINAAKEIKDEIKERRGSDAKSKDN